MLNEIKQKKYPYHKIESSKTKKEDTNYEIYLIEKKIKNINGTLDSKINKFFTFDSTINELNIERADLTTKLERLNSNLKEFNDKYEVYLFVNNLYNTYNHTKLDKDIFYYYLLDCDVITDTTTVAGDNMKNKYLKYKQKYLSLKNKIN